MIDFASPLLYIHLLIAALVLVLPGIALYMLVSRLVGREASVGLAQAILVGMGVSIAFWPLLLLYMSLVGLGFSPFLLWVLLIVSGGYVFFEVAWQRYNAAHTTLAMTRFI